MFPSPISSVSNHVASLDAKWLIRPHGTSITAGRLVRIWAPGGECQEMVVRVAAVHYLSIAPVNEGELMLDGAPVSKDVLAQIMGDSDFSLQDVIARLLRQGIYRDEPAECPVLSFVPYEGTWFSRMVKSFCYKFGKCEPAISNQAPVGRRRWNERSIV